MTPRVRAAVALTMALQLGAVVVAYREGGRHAPATHDVWQQGFRAALKAVRDEQRPQPCSVADTGACWMPYSGALCDVENVRPTKCDWLNPTVIVPEPPR